MTVMGSEKRRRPRCQLPLAVGAAAVTVASACASTGTNFLSAPAAADLRPLRPSAAHSALRRGRPSRASGSEVGPEAAAPDRRAMLLLGGAAAGALLSAFGAVPNAAAKDSEPKPLPTEERLRLNEKVLANFMDQMEDQVLGLTPKEVLDELHSFPPATGAGSLIKALMREEKARGLPIGEAGGATVVPLERKRIAYQKYQSRVDSCLYQIAVPLKEAIDKEDWEKVTAFNTATEIRSGLGKPGARQKVEYYKRLDNFFINNFSCMDTLASSVFSSAYITKETFYCKVCLAKMDASLIRLTYDAERKDKEAALQHWKEAKNAVDIYVAVMNDGLGRQVYNLREYPA